MWFIQNFIHTNFGKGKWRELMSNSIIKKSLKGSFRIDLLKIFVAAKFLQFCKSFFRTPFLQIVRYVLPDYFLQIDWMNFFKLCKLSLQTTFFANCCFRQIFPDNSLFRFNFFLVVGVVWFQNGQGGRSGPFLPWMSQSLGKQFLHALFCYAELNHACMILTLHLVSSKNHTACYLWYQHCKDIWWVIVKLSQVLWVIKSLKFSDCFDSVI